MSVDQRFSALVPRENLSKMCSRNDVKLRGTKGLETALCIHEQRFKENKWVFLKQDDFRERSA